jgi:hypothetical protein
VHFTLGELLLDLVQNAANADAGAIRIRWREGGGRFTLTVVDDGNGMPPDVVRKATDPFYTDRRAHPGRRIGLGLAFLRQLAETTGGAFRLESQLGTGTTVELDCPADHVDLPPAGDPAEVFALVLCTEGPREIEIVRECEPGAYRLLKSEMEAVLGDLSSVMGRRLLREYVRSQEDWNGEDDIG